jgi:DNA-binding IclR family transcriptional regulator
MKTPAGDGDAPSDRIFAVIDTVVAEHGPISITEIAARLGLSSPTVHRITTQLAARGYLKRALGSKRFVPGARLTDLGLRVAGAAFKADRPHAILLALAHEVKEHCQIGIMADGQVAYVDSARIARSVGLQFEPGRAAPLYCTSIGKLFLAEMTEKELEQVLANLQFERFTPSTICDRDALRREVARVRAAGWASSNGEFSAGVVGCAVPIRTQQGAMIAGLGMSVPEAHIGFEEIARFIPGLRDYAERISGALDLGASAS